jgi:hypothetical protein
MNRSIYQKTMDEKNSKKDNVNDMEEPTKHVMAYLSATITKEWFKEKLLPSTFLKDERNKDGKYYKSCKELQEDVRRGVVDILGVDNKELADPALFVISSSFLCSEEGKKISLFSDKHFTGGFEKGWVRNDRISGIHDSLKGIAESEMHSLR